MRNRRAPMRQQLPTFKVSATATTLAAPAAPPLAASPASPALHRPLAHVHEYRDAVGRKVHMRREVGADSMP